MRHISQPKTEAAIKALDEEQVPHERELWEHAGDPLKVGLGERIWRVVPLEDYEIDFNHLLGEVTEWRVA